MRAGWILLALALAACTPAAKEGAAKPPAAPSSSSGGTNEAGNGGGFGEKNLIFVARNLPSYLQLCLATPRCDLIASERTLLGKILTHWEDQPLQENQFIFRSGTKDPELFQADGRAHGPLRSAVTGPHWGDSIWINIDHLYRRSIDGTREPLEIDSLAALIVDELAHQVDPSFQTRDAHVKLDLLCVKLKSFLSARQDRPRLMGESDLRVVALNFSDSTLYPEEGAKTQVLILDGEEIVDLTPRLEKLVHCPVRDEKLDGWRIENLHWHWGKPIADERGYQTDVDYYRGTRVVPLHGYLLTRCRSVEFSPSHGLAVYFTLRFGHYLIKERTVENRNIYWYAPTQIEIIPCTAELSSDPRCH